MDRPFEDPILSLATSRFALPAVFLTAHGIGPYFRQHFLDTTFKGLYQANAFDMALLIPYFVVLILLASYGVHRYILVYLYYKHKKKRTTEPPGIFPICRGSPSNSLSSMRSLWSSGCWTRFAG